MGMTCTLYRAPDVTLHALLQQPEYFSDLTRLGESPFRYEVRPSLIGRLLGRKPRVVQLGHEQLPFGPLTEDDCHSVDKDWHVLHYLMTGSAGEVAEPLGFFFGGGQNIGTQHPNTDVVPRAFLTAETLAIATAAMALAEETLMDRFDWPEMMRQEVYPTILFDGEPPPEFLDNYRAGFGHLRDFLQVTTALNRGLVVSYS